MAAVTHDFAAARREILASFPSFFGMLQGLGAPQLNLALNQANVSGASLGQDVSAGLGALGAGSSGAGLLTRGLARNFSGQAMAQARLSYLQDLMGKSLNLVTSGLQAGMGGKRPSWYEGLPGAAISGLGTGIGSAL